MAKYNVDSIIPFFETHLEEESNRLFISKNKEYYGFLMIDLASYMKKLNNNNNRIEELRKVLVLLDELAENADEFLIEILSETVFQYIPRHERIYLLAKDSMSQNSINLLNFFKIQQKSEDHKRNSRLLILFCYLVYYRNFINQSGLRNLI